MLLTIHSLLYIQVARRYTIITTDLFAVASEVLRIHDILVWIRIRIRIRGSMLLTNGSGSSYIFVIHPQEANKNQFKKKVFLLITFEGVFT